MRIVDYDPRATGVETINSLRNVLNRKLPKGTVIIPMLSPPFIVGSETEKPNMKRNILKTTYRTVKGRRILVIKHDRFKCFLNPGPTRFTVKLEKKYYDHNEKW